MKVITALLTMLLAGVVVPARAQTGEAGDALASTRLFLMPTGRMLEPSSGYVDVIGLGVAQFQAGASDWFSFGAGTLAYVFAGERPVWLTPKFAIVKSDRVHAAAGTVHYFAPGGSGGFGYGVVTIGSTARAVTVGVVQGYGDVSEVPRALLIGFEQQRSGKTRLMIEATVFRSGGLVVAGLRRAGKKFTSDFGMAVPIAEDSPLVAFPIVNFGWRF